MTHALTEAYWLLYQSDLAVDLSVQSKYLRLSIFSQDSVPSIER